MPAQDVRREDLKRVEARVEVLAQDVDGEKLLSRYILKQACQNGDDLAVEGGLKSDLNGFRSEFHSSQSKLPVMIAEVLREVLREN
jgi:hypothetical protein